MNRTIILCALLSGCAGVIPWSTRPSEVCGDTDRACMEAVEIEAECRQLDGEYKA